MPRAPRVLQACGECRSRKIRCSGNRPRCSACVSHRRECNWSDDLLPGGYRVFAVDGTGRRRNRPPPLASSAGDDGQVVTSTDDLPGPDLRQRIFGLFKNRHLGMELCGCIDMDKCESDGWLKRSANHRALVHAITALSAPYLSDSDMEHVDAGHGNRDFMSSTLLLRHSLAKARTMSCQTSDQPQVITIQMNLCLSLRELLVASSMRAWLYCGLAIRQAQALRMRMEYNQRHDLQQQEIRRRTFWACIIMDRLVALCTFRTQTIDPGLVTIHLPASDVAFAFGHHSYGPRLDELGASPGYKTSSGSLIALPDGQPLNLRSYWIKTTVLWGYILSDYVDYGRRNFTLPPLEGPYGDHSRAIQNWCATLPVEMRWSEANLRAHRSLGQAALFAEMHILLAHARFLVQHEYLPQIHEPATATHHRPSADIPLVPGYDRAGIAFTHVDDLVIQVCVDGAFEVVDLMRVVQANNVQCTIGMGVALVTACSVLLWVVDCSRQATRGVPFDHIDHTRAEQSISYLLSVLDSGFPRHWRLSKTWASSIRLLNRFYQAHYHSVTQSETAVESSGDIDTDIAADRREDDGGEQRSTMLQIGDGLPDISMIPDGLYYKARLITGLSMEMPDLLYRKFLRQQMQPPRETRTETAATSEDAATVAETITEMPSTDDSTADFWPLDLDVMLEVDFAFLTSLDVDNDPATWTTIRGEN